ncbi:superoxide dismutase family protein [Nonomuraea dietziae]|uniref:superoxide dismutase family protein n=1 Tax=Nonomuraea dietziae TaxID=65515 RepID=UPI0033F80C5E
MHRSTHLAVAALMAAGVAAVGVSAVGEATGSSVRLGSPIRDAAGRDVGQLTVEPDGYGTSRVTVQVTGLPKGWHGFHIHATGACDPKAVDPTTSKVAPFHSAGGHFDVGGGAHGAHAGDLPSLLVNADGKGAASFATDRFRVDQLTDQDGSAVIIHALPDNFANIPSRYAPSGPDASTLKTGDAGGRIACGVIK